jgi:hypothetical protein
MECKYEAGDANQDGFINIKDIISVNNYFYQNGFGDNCSEENCGMDCNGDCSVSPADTICIRNKISGDQCAYESGDANHDGEINAVDYVAIRNNLGKDGEYLCGNDCNEDGYITNSDYICVRNKINNNVCQSEPGDANHDGKISVQDILALTSCKNEGCDDLCGNDCNEDGLITNLDIFCIKSKITSDKCIYDPGDANKDGFINATDMGAIKYALNNGNLSDLCGYDCNGSGDLTSADLFCVRAKIVGDACIYETGDANHDGSINEDDLVELRRLISTGNIDLCGADCNEDGVVNVVDLGCTKNKISGIKISNLKVDNINKNSVSIFWNTNIDSSTWLQYGKTNIYGFVEKRDEQSSVRSHKIILDSLDSNTKYYYQVGSRIESSDQDLVFMAGTFVTIKDETALNPICRELDGGRDYFKNGLTKGYSDWGRSLDMVSTFNDFCTGNNKLNEMFCGTDGYVYQESVDCENGCWLGACCGSEGCNKEYVCEDSDNGINYEEAGEVSVTKDNNILKFNDKCVELAPSQDGTNFYVKDDKYYYSSVSECSGDNCYIAEASCNGIKENFNIVSCSSCSNGACSSYSDDGEIDESNELSEDNYKPDLNKINNGVYRLQNKLDAILSELHELRDTVREQNVRIKHLQRLTQGVKKIADKMQNAINNFITYGVDGNTKKLGEGERAAVIYSYKDAFGKLPETEEDLSDAIKIANGRWPSAKNEVAERKAKNQFQKIYKRIADMNNAQDNAAVTVMAYGLRQKAENRNLNSEKIGIKTFRNIYSYNPTSTQDWNTMQAITYSGATRGIDTDGDLLVDSREKELGTDLNNRDTDGDGYLDGIEVANGYSPLK